MSVYILAYMVVSCRARDKEKGVCFLLSKLLVQTLRKIAPALTRCGRPIIRWKEKPTQLEIYMTKSQYVFGISDPPLSPA